MTFVTCSTVLWFGDAALALTDARPFGLADKLPDALVTLVAVTILCAAILLNTGFRQTGTGVALRLRTAQTVLFLGAGNCLLS